MVEDGMKKAAQKIWLIILCLSQGVHANLNEIGHLDKESVKHYKHLSVGEFVRKRFVEEKSSPAMESVSSGLAKVAGFFDKVNNRPSNKSIKIFKRSIEIDYDKSTGGTGAIWTAYYNEVNYGQLGLPVSDLSKFCKANGGSFKQAGSYNREFFDELKSSPSAVSAAYAREFNRIYVDLVLAGHGYKLSADWASNIANQVANKMQEQNALLTQQAEAFKVEAYETLKALGAFGGFACSRDGDVDWRAIILPTNPRRLTSNGTLALPIITSVFDCKISNVQCQNLSNNP
jgi:hypothetical protein